MKKIKKNVHFFRYDMYTIKHKNGEPIQKNLTVKEKRVILDDLITNKLNEGSIKILSVPNDANAFFSVFELINSTDEYIFGKIGKESDINTYQFRNEQTLKSEPILKKDNYMFESFTYFLINLNDFSVAYIQEAAAPTIAYLEKLITNEYKVSRAVWGKITALMKKDALELISKKDVIGSISYDMTIPIDSSMEITGLSRDEYKKLQHQKEIKMAVKLIVGKRNDSAFKSKAEALPFLQKLAKGKTRVNVNARDNNERFMQNYKLENNPLVKKVELEIDTLADQEKYINNLEKSMWQIFQLNQSDIDDYFGMSNDE